MWGLLVGAVLACSTPARADWPAWAIDAAHAEHGGAGFQDGFAYAMWGAAHAGTSKWVLFPKQDDRTLEVAPDPEFDSAGIPVAIHLSKKKHKIQRAPLLVFLPGIFGNVDDTGSVSEMEFYAHLGYHVVSFANPWSTSYRAARPHSMAGALHAETAAVLRLIAWAKNRIGAQWISHTNLAGVSYGAFLAAFVFGADCEAPSQLIDGSALSISPPIDIAQSMARLDQQMQELDQACYKTMSTPLFGLEFAFARSERGVASRFRACARTAVVGGFLEWLTHLVENLGPPEAVQQWKRNPGFHEYLRLLAPEVENELESGEETNLVRRIESLPASCRNRYGAISASDDFLNDPKIWDGVTSARYIVLPRGGHGGYLPDHWFSELRRKFYLSSEKSGTPTN